MKAQYAGDLCPLCGQDIAQDDEIVPRGDGVVHRGCHPGQDDVDQPVLPKASTVTRDLPPPDDPAPPLSSIMVIPEDPDGLFYDLDEPTYHAHKGSLSSTGAKTMFKAPALFDYERQHPVEKGIFDVGSAAHKYVLGVGPTIVEVEKIDPKTGEVSPATDWKTPSARAHRDRLRAEGKLGLLPKDHQLVKDMAAELLNHRLAAALLAPGKIETEVSAFKVDPDTGVLRRGRVDAMRPTKTGVTVIDYKSADSVAPAALRKAAYNNGWYIQAAYYWDLFTDCGVDVDRFVFVAQQKSPPYLVEVTVLDYPAMELGRKHYRTALQRFRDSTESGIWIGYTPDTEHSVISLPGYAYFEDDK